MPIQATAYYVYPMLHACFTGRCRLIAARPPNSLQMHHIQTYHSIHEHHIYNIQIKCKRSATRRTRALRPLRMCTETHITSISNITYKIVLYVKMHEHDYAMTVGCNPKTLGSPRSHLIKCVILWWFLRVPISTTNHLFFLFFFILFYFVFFFFVPVFETWEKKLWYENETQ